MKTNFDKISTDVQSFFSSKTFSSENILNLKNNLMETIEPVRKSAVSAGEYLVDKAKDFATYVDRSLVIRNIENANISNSFKQLEQLSDEQLEQLSKDIAVEDAEYEKRRTKFILTWLDEHYQK